MDVGGWRGRGRGKRREGETERERERVNEKLLPVTHMFCTYFITGGQKITLFHKRL